MRGLKELIIFPVASRLPSPCIHHYTMVRLLRFLFKEISNLSKLAFWLGGTSGAKEQQVPRKKTN